MTAARRASSLSASALVLVASGCVGRASAPAEKADSIRVVGVSAVRDVSSNDSYVAPDGSAWIYNDDDRLCVGRQAEPDADPTCAAWDQSISSVGVSWSSDATRVAFTQDYVTGLEEPDVYVFDIDDGRIDALTDDGVDGMINGDGDLDLFPFFGPDDEVYFFRSTRDDEPFALYRLVDGEATPVDGGQFVDGFIAGPPIASGDNVWTVRFFRGRAEEHASMAFDGSGSDTSVSVNELWAPEDPGPGARLADAAAGTLLMSPDLATGTAAVVVIPDAQASVELAVDDESKMDSFGGGVTLSASGNWVLELRPTGDDGMQFATWRVDADGDKITVEPSDVGLVTDDRIGSGVGLKPGTLGWDGGTTLTAIGTGGVVVFDVTTSD